MLDWLGRTLATTTTSLTFFTLFLVGVTFSVFSLIFGGHGGDHSVDHDTGHDTDADHGGDSSADHDAGGDGSSFSVGMFSVRGVALLCTGFGGIGFLVYTGTEKIFFSTAGALVGGYVFAFIVLYTLKVFKSQQANSLVDMSRAVGAQGVVTVSIPENGIGEVSLMVSGMEMFKSARSLNGKGIRSGASIQVSRVSGGTFIVTPADVSSAASVNSERNT